MQSAVLAMIDSVYLSICLSVTRWYHAKTTQARIMWSSLEDSPMTLVSLGLTSPPNCLFDRMTRTHLQEYKLINVADNKSHKIIARICIRIMRQSQ